jgi:hypothetical protein
MLISQPHKFVFVHVPKTAGSAIHIHLKDHYKLKGRERADPPPEIHHMGAKELLSQYSECKEYFKFAFVRNPYDRFLSAYSEFTQLEHREGYHLDIFKYKDFSHFCVELHNSEWIKDVHFRPQHEFLYDGDDCLVDFVGRYENLEEDWNHALQTVGIPAITLSTIPRHRKTRHAHWSAHYLPRTKRAIKECYARDFELFGYGD